MFSGIWRKAKKKNMKKERKFGLKEFPRPLVICYGGLQVIEGHISVGKFSIISTYFSMIMSSVDYFTSLSSNYQQALVSYDRLMEFENEPKEVNGLIKLNDIFKISRC